MFSFSIYTSLAYIVTTVVEMTFLHDWRTNVYCDQIG